MMCNIGIIYFGGEDSAKAAEWYAKAEAAQ